MQTKSGKMPLAAKLLVVLHIFLALGALGGGGFLIFDPSGKTMQWQTTMLAGSPFRDFLIPGIILFLILGVCPLLTAFALATKRPCKAANQLNLFKQKHWSWAYSLYLGFSVIIWITVEAYIIQTVQLLQVIYIGVGLLLQAVTLLPCVQEYYQQK